MKSITIHDLDDSLDGLIREKAEREGVSLNITIIMLLRQGMGISEDGEDHRQDFVEFLGKWSGKELIEFNEQIREFTVVHAGDWQ